ncbi:unnamed protein product [Bursaphelenchus xylophilus]|uniref:(pine wood nematode) hypothetical protein n=1 Tax=Bursaphelenchus xylophilus TaxID=6326 RepID=A0A1I7RH87_BURXY|nr:unnamed protein product [Bursaphelenchus xylophilus]CAG9115932.1 unnamed protein product [Bursaphelenchus xylophilus]
MVRTVKPKSAQHPNQIRHRPVLKASTSKYQILTKEERDELRRLAECLPMVMRANQKSDDPASIVFNAASYIDKLVATITAKVKSGSLPPEALENITPRPAMPLRPLNQKTQKVKRRRRS